MEKEKKGRAIALLPIGVFLIIFLGAGIVFKDFYAMPAIVAFLIALFVAFLQNKELSFNKKIEVIAKGVGEETIITMSLIFLCAGGFSGAVTAAGGVDSTVNLGLSLIPAHFAVAGLFLIGCFISVSMELPWERLQHLHRSQLESVKRQDLHLVSASEQLCVELCLEITFL